MSFGSGNSVFKEIERTVNKYDHWKRNIPSRNYVEDEKELVFHCKHASTFSQLHLSEDHLYLQHDPISLTFHGRVQLYLRQNL